MSEGEGFLDGAFLDDALRSVFRPLGRAGTAGSLRAIRAAFLDRAARRGQSPGVALRHLLGRPSEALAVWDRATLATEGAFFRHPAVFQALGGLMSEWAALAPRKSIRALVLRAGLGHEAASLAIELSGRGFLLRDWDLRISALDPSPKALERALEFSFPPPDLESLEAPLRRKHFRQARGAFHLRQGLRDIIGPALGDPFLRPANDPLPALSGGVDLLLARGFLRDLPDASLGALRGLIPGLLAEGGLAFLAPGELWLPGDGLSLEERGGVFFFRKGGGRQRPNRFFQAKARKGRPRPEPQARPSPRLDQIRKSAAMLLPGSPGKARSFALEAISSAQEEAGSYSPGDYRILAEAERALGRPKVADALFEALEAMGGGDI
jgi:chemotaxis methyl-accepting protein methylase